MTANLPNWDPNQGDGNDLRRCGGGPLSLSTSPVSHLHPSLEKALADSRGAYAELFADRCKR